MMPGDTRQADSRMKAIVSHSPFDICVEKRPQPVLQQNTDAIDKVQTTGYAVG